MKPDEVSDIIDVKDIDSGENYYTDTFKSEYTDTDGFPRTNDKNKAIAYLKTVVQDGQAKDTYYVLTNDKGQLYDPNGLFMEETLHKTKSMAGRKVWGWKRYNEEVFSNYLRFLRTKNKANLLYAQRKATDG